MRISLNWLKEYVDIPKSIAPEKMGELLTLHSIEIEEIIDQAKKFENIIVGRILEIEKHPNADKLKLVNVDIDEKKPIQVVCGGANLREGMLVAFAKVGAKVRWHGKGNLITLKKTKIRGKISEGMICSACEIGLERYKAKNATILELEDKGMKIGISLAETFGLNDVILEVDNKTITNRPDLWSHYGVAREIAAILRLKVKSENLKFDLNQKRDIKYNLKVEVKDQKLCPRYQAVVVDNIKIEPSPFWMRQRLISAGVKPVNNIVDITNYVMLDLGQPLHAFDYSKLSNRSESGADKTKIKYESQKGIKIIVRRAKNGEKIITLDNIERNLNDKMLVIADEEKPIALAGVMGGVNSEIDDKTARIIIESANFESINNRQTSVKLGLRTEAAVRYEKGLDPNLTEICLKKVLKLISEIIPQSNIASKIIDQKKFKLNQGPIVLSTNFVQRKIGIKIDSKHIADILSRLGFEVFQKSLLAPPLKVGETVFKVKIPTWRATKDVSTADDLIEEIARIYGFEKIKPITPLVEMKVPEINRERKFERRIKNILNSFGFDEIYNYAIIGENRLQKIGRDSGDYIKLLNGLSREHILLRQSLLENLIVNVKDNLRYFDKFKIFELGSIFQKTEGRYSAHPDKRCKLPKQEKFIGGIIADVDKKPNELFFQSKEAVENLLNRVGINDYQIAPINTRHSDHAGAEEEFRGKSDIVDTAKFFANTQNDSGASADIVVNNQKIGQIGILNKNIKINFDINPETACGFFELSFDELFALPRPEIKCQPLAKFPEVKIDLALLAPREILWHNIEEEIKKAAGVKLKKIELFDIYEGKNIGAGKKNLAMHLNFGEDVRTMEMWEVEKLRDKIVCELNKKWGIEMRR